MKKVAFFTFLTISLSFYCQAQITWEKLFVKSNTDVFRSVEEVPAGGYIAAGYTSDWNDNDTDAFVVRLNIYGDTLWTRTFNGGKKDLFYKVKNTADGGFILCGYSSSYNGGSSDDAYYMKLDINGNMLWQFTYGGPLTKERAQDIIQTADGGYAMAGYTNNGQPSYNSFLMKIDANGGQTWVKKYGGSTTYDDANALKELPDGGFIMAGQTVINNPVNLAGQIFLVRTNVNGDTIWTRSFGTDTLGANENAEDIQLAAAGGFIICGSTDSTGNDDGYLVKTDTGGVVQWTKKFGGDLPDDFHRVENTTDGGFIITGTSQSNVTQISDQWLFKTNATGDSTWARTFGGANHDHAYSGMQTSDGGYILCGYTASFGFNYEDALVVKVDGTGQLYNHLYYSRVTALVTPVDLTCGNPNTVVTITVRNFGDTALSTFPDTVIITGAINQTLGQTFIGNISPLNTANHTFAAIINTSAGGVFNFHCFTSTNNDVYPAMNTYDVSITLLGQPSPPVTTGDTTCGPGTVTLTATSPDNISWFSTSTGGVSLGSGPTYSPTISTTTTYYAECSNSCGTSSRTPVVALVLPVTPAPTVVSAERCGPGEVTLQASSADPISWWDSATGGIMLQGNLSSYVVNVLTTSTFYVEAGTGSGCPSTREPVTATVNPLPDAAFTSSAPAVCLGDTFQFTNTTTGAISYSWDFGDAIGTSILTDPDYSYANTGNYTVQLVAASNLNCYDTATLIVNVNTAPSVSFGASSASGCLPFTVNFTNATTNATNYLWNFGDGFTSTDAEPMHEYTTEGTFTVTLFATVGSCADSDSTVGMITTHTPPTIDLGPDIITNSVTYLIDAGPGFASYLWNNGSVTQTITADTNGTYCVVVTDNNACSDTDCVDITLDALSADALSGNFIFMIYPNPAGDRFNIISSIASGQTSGKVEIMNTVGQEIYSAELNTGCFTVKTADWQRGIYLVTVKAEGKTLRKTLILY